MASVTGVGGAFLRAHDPERLYEWYERHLGLERAHGAFTFSAATQRAQIVVAFFDRDDDYFPTQQPAMLNLQVDDLEAVMARLASEGVVVDANRQRYDFGTFGWFTDPEGNRVELWQPT